MPPNIQYAYVDLCMAFSCLLARTPQEGANAENTGRAARLVLDAIAALLAEYPALRHR